MSEQPGIDTLKQIKESLTAPAVRDNVQAAIIVSPAKEAEQSLVTILKHRTAKLQSSFDFEELVKDTIEARMSEASFPQLIQLLEKIQDGNSRAVEGILAPLLAANASASDAVRGSREADSAASEVYSKTDDKRVLQGLVALNQLLDLIKSKQGNAETVTAEIVPSHEQSDDSSS